MRTIIPGNVSPAYLQALRDTQIDFFKSITMSDEQAKLVRERNPINGVSPTQHKRATEPGKVSA